VAAAAVVAGEAVSSSRLVITSSKMSTTHVNKVNEVGEEVGVAQSAGFNLAIKVDQRLRPLPRRRQPLVPLVHLRLLLELVLQEQGLMRLLVLLVASILGILPEINPLRNIPIRPEDTVRATKTPLKTQEIGVTTFQRQKTGIMKSTQVLWLIPRYLPRRISNRNCPQPWAIIEVPYNNPPQRDSNSNSNNSLQQQQQ
jgi:hypothetical protein